MKMLVYKKHVLRSMVPVAMFAAALATGGCHHVEAWDDLEGAVADHSLTNLSDCAALESYARNAASTLMRSQVERERDWSLEWAENDEGVFAGSDGDADGDADADGSTNEGSSAGDVSETNTQEEGVDEADLMKTDGDYLYSLYKGQLVIVEAGDNGALDEAGRVEVGGYAEEMFIYGNTAVVFSSLDSASVPPELRYDIDYGDGDTYYSDCWSGWCYGSYRYAQVALLDITDKTSPQVLRTIAYSGEYTTSRRVDNSLRVVLYSPLPALEMRWYYDYEVEYDWTSESSINEYYQNIIDQNEARFATVTLDEIMPKKVDSMDGIVTDIIPCDQVLAPVTPTGIGLTTVVSIDLDQPAGTAETTSIFGSKGIVYASETGLYLSTSRAYVQEAFASGLWSQETSGIHKLDISRSDSAAYYLGTGVVDGRMLDQFCMGEHDGNLRVATTTGDAWGDVGLENHVFVLGPPSGTTMNVIGRLDGLGLDQEIYAARFMGDRGYLVTYLQVDPFYTLDMSDPTAPAVMGEWHGPGYSTYLHPVGDDRVISVGMEDGRAALSLYDISDFSSPQLLSRVFMPDWEYTSPAVYEHKAFTFNSNTGMLALPYFEWSYNDTGIMLYDVTETGIAQSGSLHLNEGDDYYEGTARRSAYIGDYLYGISRCRITSGLISDPATAVDSVELFNLGACDDYSDAYMGWSDWD